VHIVDGMGTVKWPFTRQVFFFGRFFSEFFFGGSVFFSNEERRDYMRMLLTRSGNIALTIIITLLTLSLLCRLLSVRLGGSIVNLSEFYSYRLIEKLTDFETSGVQSVQSNMGAFFHFRRTSFSSMLKSRVSSILDKSVSLLINLNLDGVTITSKSYTHP
jgi:hypothetical protein